MGLHTRYPVISYLACSLIACTAFIGGARFQWWLIAKGWCSRSFEGGPAPIVTNGPQVVVNVPSDYKPLEPIMVDGKPALVGPRALLWYSAYSKALSAFSGGASYTVDIDDEQAAFETARAAVVQVYGNTHDA